MQNVIIDGLERHNGEIGTPDDLLEAIGFYGASIQDREEVMREVWYLVQAGKIEITPELTVRLLIDDEE